MRSSSHRSFRKAPITAGVCLAFAVGSASLPLFAAVVQVQNCDEASLRNAIASAAPGATVDLSQLPTACGMVDSTITLSNGEISVPQDNLTLQGPSVGSVTITPAAGSQGRVLYHTGNGVLAINALTLANGNLQAGANTANGGCIESHGSLSFTLSTVRDCTAAGATAFGGGIHADGSVLLRESTVSGNKAIGAPPNNIGLGGGVFAGEGLTIKYSTLSTNEANLGGGGAYSAPKLGVYTTVLHSTIEGNKAYKCAAGAFFTNDGISIANSTISLNTASAGRGGLCVSGLVEFSSSTIAFNTSANQYPGSASGIWASDGQLTLESSIIAHNGEYPLATDVYARYDVQVTGSDNVIMSANANVPASVIKITADPKLGPLLFNGGRTRTHALLPGSLAIGAGNNNAASLTDQRGTGYPRTTGAGATTDIGAFQFDSIFADDFEW